jgi:hypothetical protein
MKFGILTLAATSLLASHVAFAQGKKAKPQASAAAKNYAAPAYGMAGCGLGSLVFSGTKNNTMGTQILAATTNDAVFPQSSAITSGTSNCSDTPAGSEEAFRIERETYVSMNLGDLSKEASKGDGNHLRGLAQMIGCSSDEQVKTFATVAQSSHSEIFSDSVPANVAERFVSTAKSSEELQNCVRGE